MVQRINSCWYKTLSRNPRFVASGMDSLQGGCGGFRAMQMQGGIMTSVLTCTIILSLRAVLLAPAAEDAPIIPKDAKWEKLWSEGEFTEGPAYGPDACVYFTDIGNRIMKY